MNVVVVTLQTCHIRPGAGQCCQLAWRVKPDAELGPEQMNIVMSISGTAATDNDSVAVQTAAAGFSEFSSLLNWIEIF